MFYTPHKKKPSGGPGLADRRLHSFMHACMHSTPFAPSLYQTCTRHIEWYQRIAYDFPSFEYPTWNKFPSQASSSFVYKMRRLDRVSRVLIIFQNKLLFFLILMPALLCQAGLRRRWSWNMSMKVLCQVKSTAQNGMHYPLCCCHSPQTPRRKLCKGLLDNIPLGS